MKCVLFFVLLLPLVSHAGWFKNFCEKHIIAEDPWPMAEVDTTVLLSIYDYKPDRFALDELLYRYRAGMLSEDETKEMWRVIEKHKVTK